MATAPEPAGPGDRALALSLREAQVRLSQLVGLAELADQVTLIHRDGRPVAAVVPAAAARSRAQERAAGERARASAAGWARRLAELREQLGRRHRAELDALRRALGETWAALDRYGPPGTDRDLDRLRAAHRDLLAPGDGPASRAA